MSLELLGFESIRKPQGGVWQYLSPSRLNCWIRCPRAFAFRYLQGIKTPTTPGLFLGTAVHWALRVHVSFCKSNRGSGRPADIGAARTRGKVGS
jgi:hypothetical protein